MPMSASVGVGVGRADSNFGGLFPCPLTIHLHRGEQLASAALRLCFESLTAASAGRDNPKKHKYSKVYFAIQGGRTMTPSDDDDLTPDENFYEWTKKLRKARPEKRLGSDQYQQGEQHFSYSDVNDDSDVE